MNDVNTDEEDIRDSIYRILAYRWIDWTLYGMGVGVVAGALFVAGAVWWGLL